MGSAELLENGLVISRRMFRSLSGVIRTEAARLVTLVEDIIHLSQLDEGIAPAKGRGKPSGACGQRGFRSAGAGGGTAY